MNSFLLRKLMQEDRHPFIFIVDDIEENLQVLGNMLFNRDYEVSLANNGSEALEIMNWDELPDIILLDVMMPDIDGFEVCRKLKSNPKTAHIPVIFLTAKAESESIIEGFKAGGVDYITKPFRREELLVRIETHLELKFSRETLLNKSRELELLNDKLRESEIRLKDFNNQLVAINKINEQYLQRINGEIEKAAKYVRLIIPKPIIDDNISIIWKFQPSDKLGGDIFGYHYLSDSELAIYLIDVCGHGIDATLHAVSVINTIRYKTLGNVDFSKPASVLNQLNKIYQMSDKNHLYFTAWYGVINFENKSMEYCGAAQPPALLFKQNELLGELDSKFMMVGGLPDTEYQSEIINILPNSSLYIFSDGAYEITTKEGKQLTYRDIADFLITVDKSTDDELDKLFDFISNSNRESELKDDFSILKIKFH